MSVIIRVTKSVVVGLLVSSLDTFRDHWPSNLSVILLGALAFTTVVRPSSFYRDDKDETTAYYSFIYPGKNQQKPNTHTPHNDITI